MEKTNGYDECSVTSHTDCDVEKVTSEEEPMNGAEKSSVAVNGDEMVHQAEEDIIVELKQVITPASKKRKSKRKSDGYMRPKKRSKQSKDEYEVEMIVDHKIEDVRTHKNITC